MEYDNFEAQAEQLFNGAIEPLSEYCESLEYERRAIVASFREHATALDMVGREEGGVPVSRLYGNERFNALDQLVQIDVSRFPQLLEGSIRVTGRGIFSAQPTETGVQAMIPGEELRGRIHCYLSGEELLGEDDERGVIPDELFVMLEDVRQFDEEGEVVERYEYVSVPLTDMDLRFERMVSRQADADARKVYLGELLTNSNIQNRCIEVEEWLNGGECSEEELTQRLCQAREELYQEIYTTMSGPMPVEGFATGLVDGEIYYLANDLVTYVRPDIVRLDGVWRVVHCMTAVNGELSVYMVSGDVVSPSARATED